MIRGQLITNRNVFICQIVCNWYPVATEIAYCFTLADRQKRNSCRQRRCVWATWDVRRAVGCWSEKAAADSVGIYDCCRSSETRSRQP